MNDKVLEDIEERFEVLINMLHEVRNTRGDANGRALSVSITNVETGRLWYEDSIKEILSSNE